MATKPITMPDGTIGCQQGYHLDAASGLCLPDLGTISMQVLGSTPEQNWTIPDINVAQVDEKARAQLTGLGLELSGIVDYLLAGLAHILVIHMRPILALFLSILDDWCALLAEGLTVAQGEGTPGFYTLSAALIGDLFGVAVDSGQLQQQYVTGGRLASITAIGSNIVNLLASEFMGVYQSSGAEGYTVPPGAGVGGLPVADMSEAQGVHAAQAFLGFATEFAVREGNAELFAASIPYGLGEGVRDMAVNVAKAVNLGRMGRVALMPLFRKLVAEPLEWAINVQYRPQLLGEAEAVAALYTDDFTAEQLATELQRHGYADNKIAALEYVHAQHLHPAQILTLIAKGDLTPVDWSTRVRKLRWDVDEQDKLLTEMEFQPARRICLAQAEKAVTGYIDGSWQLQDAQDTLTTLPYLTAGEKQWLQALVDQTTALHSRTPHVHPKQIGIGEWKKAFYAGIITLNDLETAIAAHYPDPQQQQIVLLEDLLGQVGYEVAQERLAIAAAKYGISVPGLPKL